MTKKNIVLISILAILAGTYVWCFTNWFHAKTVRIASFIPPFHTPGERHRAEILFRLFGTYRLTEVKVVPLAVFAHDPSAPPLWHLISDSNSVPVEKFAYGQRIHGMRPAIRDAEPDDLQTNVTYRLIVVAGHIQGTHDFEIK